VLAGRCDRITAAWEMLAQFVGGLIGGILLKISIPHTCVPGREGGRDGVSE
jgi:hypothetical protein